MLDTAMLDTNDIAISTSTELTIYMLMLIKHGIHLQVTATAQIIPQIGAALGDVAFLMLVGYSYQNYGPYTLWTYELILCAAICVVVWVMQIIGSIHGDRYKEPRSQS